MVKKDNLFCPYCWPTKINNYFIFHVQYYIEKVTNLVKSLNFLSVRGKFIGTNIERLLFEVLAFLRIARFIYQPDDRDLRNRSLIFFKEAKRRGLDIAAIKILGRYRNEFRLIYNKRKVYYQDIPFTAFGSPVDLDNKIQIKKILKKSGIPVPEGVLFTSPKKAIQYAEIIGYPVVIKPNTGSLSQHVTAFIKGRSQLMEAISIAQIYRPDFIVEKYVTGELYRASVIGQQEVFVSHKERANVVGDGISSISELIFKKNNNPWRGEAGQINSTLFKIQIDDDLIANLHAQGCNLDTVLPAGAKVYLKNKFILSEGCDILNCNELVHRDNRELFIKIAQLLKTDLVGIDLICSDVSQSFKDQEAVILETNSLPYIDMHQFPSHGKPALVAEKVWHIFLEKLAAVSK